MKVKLDENLGAMGATLLRSAGFDVGYGSVPESAVDTGCGSPIACICDRDAKSSRAVVEFLEREGVRIIRTPVCAPNCNAERNHQGIGNELIQPLKRAGSQGPVRRRKRMGGMPNSCYRAAA